MPHNPTTGTFDPSDQMLKLLEEKGGANELQERRHDAWDENYQLYRNKVKTNRLTQRQPVNIPLMKETIKTLLASIDDPPNIEWSERSGDEQKELIYQEIWNDQYKQRKFELEDVKDKKNVLLYGIGTKKLNIVDDGVTVDALDPYDVVFDPLMKVGDIETARYVVQQNIFRSVREILADDRYSKEGKKELKLWKDSSPGIIQSEVSREQWEEKMERLVSMGVDHSDFKLYAGGDVLVNLTEHYTTMWEGDKWVRRVVVYADDMIELLDEKLETLIGVDFWPFVVWTEDPEATDLYSDGVADLVRTPNKVLNVWFSQLIENRTLKNFQMHWFTPSQNFTPTTYQPGPGVMLPAPPGEDINKVLKPVEISGLDDTLEAISQVTQIVERGSGATAIQKGQGEQGEQTLGEIKVLVGKASERTIGMAKFYRMSWYELSWKWDKMMHENAPAFMTLFKTGRSGKTYPKRVFKNDWKSTAGYEPTVRASSEQELEDTKAIQKWLFVLQQFPANETLRKVGQGRMLELLDLTPEELRQVEESEEKVIEAEQPQLVQATPQARPAQPKPAGANPQLVQSVQKKMQELQSLTT